MVTSAADNQKRTKTESKPLSLKRIAGLSLLETFKDAAGNQTKSCSNRSRILQINSLRSSLPHELYCFLLNNASEP